MPNPVHQKSEASVQPYDDAAWVRDNLAGVLVRLPADVSVDEQINAVTGYVGWIREIAEAGYRLVHGADPTEYQAAWMAGGIEATHTLSKFVAWGRTEEEAREALERFLIIHVDQWRNRSGAVSYLSEAAADLIQQLKDDSG